MDFEYKIVSPFLANKIVRLRSEKSSMQALTIIISSIFSLTEKWMMNFLTSERSLRRWRNQQLHRHFAHLWSKTTKTSI